MLTLSVVLFFSLVLNRNCQIIPLRFHFSIDLLRQYQHFSLINLIEDVEYNVTPEQIFEIIVQSILKRHTWSLKVLDVWRKVSPSDILKGNVYWMGNSDV
jgi:hypothetical protein